MIPVLPKIGKPSTYFDFSLVLVSWFRLKNIDFLK